MKLTIIVHLLFTYSTIHLTYSSTPPKKHASFQIDEFIKQLMTSEKFDELTDVIADKAAQKIKYMESHMTTNENDKDNSRPNDNNKNKDARSEEKTNREDKENHDSESHKENDRKSTDKSKNYDRERERDSRSNEKSYGRERKRDNEPGSAERSNHDRERHREKDTKSSERINRDDSETRQKNENNRKAVKFGKIDTQTFLKNHMTSKELELNFKHLTGELEKHRFNVKQNPNADKDSNKEKKRSEHSENTRSGEQHDSGSNKREDEPVKKSEDHEEKNESKEIKITDHSSNENKEAHEQDTFHETDKNSGEIKPGNETDSLKEDRRQAEPKYNAHISNEKPIPRIQKQDGDTDEFIKSLEGLETSLEEENEDNMPPDQKLPEDSTNSKKKVLGVDVAVNRARSDQTNRAVSEENLSIPEVIPIVNSITPKKRPVREENGRLFTFESSPEYAEYHEKVAKLSQQKYINTYKKKK